MVKLLGGCKKTVILNRNKKKLTFLFARAWLLSAASIFSPGGLEPQRRPIIKAYAMDITTIGKKNKTADT